MTLIKAARFFFPSSTKKRAPRTKIRRSEISANHAGISGFSLTFVNVFYAG